jgi:hypothetical protein
MLADYQNLLFGKELKQTGESGGSSEISSKKSKRKFQKKFAITVGIEAKGADIDHLYDNDETEKLEGD